MLQGTWDSGGYCVSVDQQRAAPFAAAASELLYRNTVSREVPSYLQLIQLLQQRDSLRVDIVAVDGFGALHPRGAGAATQLGVQARVPCIGVGKSLSGACALREREVLVAMDERTSLQLDLSSFCAAHTSAVSVCHKIPCFALRKKLSSRRPVYVTVNTPMPKS
jgi:deoxyinosine 3'endonuclease (endonuclease V)